MRKLRSTFKRSRTPTGAEMKSQSSLEVPKQVRSASFDEIQLEVQRLDQNSEMRQTRGPGPGPGSGSPIRTSLKVPVATSQRSRSFDMYEKSSLLGTTSRSVRKELLVQVACYHCVCVEEFKKLSQARSESDKDSDDDSTGSTHLRVCNDDYDADDDLPRSDASDRSESALEDENEGPRDGSPEIRVTLLNFDEYDVDGSSDEGIRVEFVPERTRRLSRQEALIELPAILGPEEDDDDEEEDDEVEKAKLVVRDIFLTVPELKRDRAASVDSCFNSAKSCQSDDSGCLTVPQQGARSKSVDIVLPTDQQTRYTALLPNKDDRRGWVGKSDSGASSSRELRSTPDWSSEAINGEHLWVPTAASGEFCYANDCSVDGEACRVLPSIMEIKLLNRATMLAKRRSSGKGRTRSQGDKLESLKLQIMRIKMKDYETYHSDKERLIGAAVPLTPEPLDLEATMDLESLRKLLARDFNMDNCCFLDSCTAERFFRIDRAQEQLHYVTDVASEAVFVLEEDAAVTNIEEAGKADASPSIPDESINVEGKSINLEQSNVDKGQKSKDSVEKDVPVEGSTETQRHSPDNDNDKVNEESVPKKEPEPRQSSSKSVAPERFDRAPSSAFISARERLFSLAPEVQLGMNPLLEKPSDGIIRAAKTGDLKSLRELHSRGYSLLSIDANGQTALHLAARHGYKDIVRYLIACAPPSILNMADNDKGQTALHKAAQQKRRSICCMLVAGGATLTAKDRHGNTPRELALMSEDRDLAAYLYSQEQFHLDTEDMLLNLP
ncbi:GSCOCG00008640001-RA-CDS [Cotesia congregata]|nr:GSCOCG00008640001-RA-CDS [Cotesia congregata]